MTPPRISSHALTAPESVFLTALGADAQLLRPEVLEYVTGAGANIGVCKGTFDVAGSRFRWLGNIARPFVGPQLMMTRYGHDVLFRVENRAVVTETGTSELRAGRSFRFDAGPQIFIDVLQIGPTPGTLRNLLGRSHRVELLLRCSVTSTGHLSLKSERAWFRLGRLRIPLPTFLSVSAEVEDGFDEVTQRHTVDARVRNALLGTVLEYRGSFNYDVETRRMLPS